LIPFTVIFDKEKRFVRNKFTKKSGTVYRSSIMKIQFLTSAFRARSR